MILDAYCTDCPALRLRTITQLVKINKWIKIFEYQISRINKVKYILLGESFPPNRYIYDLNSSYSGSGLRHNLLIEFGLSDENRLLEFLIERKTIIIDCAYCPLCNLSKSSDKRNAATHCLKKYKLELLDSLDAKIITFFPKNSGFLKRELPSIQEKVIKSFQFSNLKGLNELIK